MWGVGWTDELATLMMLPSSCPRRTPRTRLFFDGGTREAWSTTWSGISWRVGCVKGKRDWERGIYGEEDEGVDYAVEQFDQLDFPRKSNDRM